jgi:hypothetical protein
LIIDPSFEEHHPAWVIPFTSYPANYARERVHDGEWAMRAGIVYGQDAYSYSSFQQTITLPSNLKRAVLSFWWYPITGDAAGDSQYVLIMRSPDDYFYAMRVLQNDQRWLLYEYSVLSWAGQTITIRFSVLNDGDGRLTSMYVDEVKVIVERWGSSAMEEIPLADLIEE